MKKEVNSQYNILYLEDDALQDKRITKFQELAKENNLYLEIVNNPDSFLDKSKRTGRNTIVWDAIICDIEIWQKSDEGVNLLIGLGFNYIDHLIKEGIHCVYIIISNTPTSFFNKITSSISGIDVLQDVLQKDKIFKNVGSINDFITDIIEHINNKRQKLIENTPITKSLFEVYNNYIHQQTNYPLKITLKGISVTCYNYSDIENVITKHLDWLISEWTQILETDIDKTRGHKNNKMNNIVSSLKMGGEFRKNDLSFDSKKITSFIKKLILRRFVIYVSLKHQTSIKDACLTISLQEKCFDNILLFSNTTDNYSKEEKEYMNLLNTSIVE